MRKQIKLYFTKIVTLTTLLVFASILVLCKENKKIPSIEKQDDIESILKPIKPSILKLAYAENKDYDQLRTIMSVVQDDEQRSLTRGN